MEPAVNGVGDEFVEIFGEGSNVLCDGPFIVVQNENELFGRAGDVVQGLERDSASEGGISGNGDHMFVSSFEVTGHASAQGCGQGGSGMSGSKGIMLTFFPRNESAQAFGLPDFVKALVVPAGQEFVNVSLVGNVPKKGILRCFEYKMKGYGQFDHSKVWAHVPSVFGGRFDDPISDLTAKLLDLCLIQLLQVGRTRNARQYFGLIHSSAGVKFRSSSSPFWSVTSLTFISARSIFERQSLSKRTPD